MDLWSCLSNTSSGDGNNMYYFTYGENVAHAHICADRALASEITVAEKAAGQAYFITNMEPIKFWEFVSLILEGLGYERPRIKIPAAVLMPITYMVEYAYKLLAPYGMKEGLKRTIKSLPHLRAEVRSKKDGRSKASIFLGNGRRLDIESRKFWSQNSSSPMKCHSKLLNQLLLGGILQ